MTNGAATFWQGTALKECSESRLILRHSVFNSSYELDRDCGESGQILGRPIFGNENVFISTLTINISQNTVGRFIECSSDGTEECESQIARKEISLTSDNGMYFSYKFTLFKNNIMLSLQIISRHQVMFTFLASPMEN